MIDRMTTLKSHRVEENFKEEIAKLVKAKEETEKEIARIKEEIAKAKEEAEKYERKL